MGSLREVVWLCVALVVAGCGNPRTPEGAGYRITVKLSPAKGADALPPIRPDDVKVFRSTKEPPPGVSFKSFAMVAQDYPSPEHPHRRIGELMVRESIDYLLDPFDDPAFVAEREAAVRREAAAHGANAVFFLHDQHPEPGRHNLSYMAFALSDAEPVYPSPSEILEKLHLEADGFKEVHRFTAKLADLPSRKPEALTLKGGHAYMLAIALHPGPVDMRLGKDEALGFLVKAERDPFLDRDRAGTFEERTDKTYPPELRARALVDGVFARGGAGTMGGNGRAVKIELVTRPATLRFALHDAFKGMKPIHEMGAGEADFIVYERKLPRDELVKTVCDYCERAARTCSKRRALESCEELQKCFGPIEQPISMCSKAYERL